MCNILNVITTTLQTFFSHNWTSKDFLTEDDLRCHLFNMLHQSLVAYQRVSVHAEVRWYGEINTQNNTQLRYRSDIVIIDHEDLRERDFPPKLLPSKGYGFDNYYAIIEIKLRRLNDKNSDDSYMRIIQSEIEKLKEIRRRTTRYNDLKKFFVIVFDKKRQRKLLYQLDELDNLNAFQSHWENWSI